MGIDDTTHRKCKHLLKAILVAKYAKKLKDFMQPLTW
jgi:hypothetical protein